MCQPGVSPTASHPCEPGVSADDAQDGPSIQSGVLLCPPPNCRSTGCSGSHLGEKDVPACGIDTSNNSTAVGTTFVLTFVVYNSAGLSASAQRTVTVVSPCEPGSNLCSDGQCHAVDCDSVYKLRALQGPDPGAPAPLMVLVLLPTAATNFTQLLAEGADAVNRTVFTVYGQPAPFSLLPCASALHLSSVVHCAAAAMQVMPNGSLSDAAAYITIEDVSTNVTAR